MGKNNLDLSKMMALMSQGPKNPIPFTGEKRNLEIPFLTRDGSPACRFLRVYLPAGAARPMPLVFAAHYEIAEGSPELALYLSKGWAVSTPIKFEAAFNGRLTDDDLVFNCAALSAVRKLPEIDRTRIAVVGGSAGGYMALMLSALHLGICCSVSFSGITNVLFGMRHYFETAHGYNLRAFEEELDEEEKTFLLSRLETAVVPVLGEIFDQFAPIRENFPDMEDNARFAAFSPSCLAYCFSNPILFSHFTSDVLVPVDQLTKRFTYEKPGETLPEGFRLRMSEFPLPEKLNLSMAEALPAEELAECLYPVPEGNDDVVIPYDLSKRFNISVFDEGCVEADAGHQKNLGLGKNDASAYIEAQFARSSRQTSWLSAEKLAMLAERYAGNSTQLPAHGGVDETVYGSAAAYRQEVLEELSFFAMNRDFAADCGKETLAEAFDKTEAAKPELAKVLGELKAAVL